MNKQEIEHWMLCMEHKVWYLDEVVKTLLPKEQAPSSKWAKLRYKVLKTYGSVCMCCRESKGTMHVDHIKPKSKYPELEMDFNNLQVLCYPCNIGKGNEDETDWRTTKETQLSSNADT